MAQLVFESKNLGIGGVGFLVSSYAMTSTINPLFGNQKFRAGVQQSRELHDISFLHFTWVVLPYTGLNHRALPV